MFVSSRAIFIVLIFILALLTDAELNIEKNHPSKVLKLLENNCKEFEHACIMSCEDTAQFLLNIGLLLVEYEENLDHQLIKKIEKLAINLQGRKSVEDVIEYQKLYGKDFEIVMERASEILAKVPYSERKMWEELILQPPPLF
ncbi:unnamed protein product [Caenorhabditis bovis]|uniref:Uncharacterized protein n=1 Tax=Caenorhabditis bovis TaxID=2654633 RepID=A0A8S1F6Q7_9PELO|nr:unnamed protein product [Caenorhabditis bovis]